VPGGSRGKLFAPSAVAAAPGRSVVSHTLWTLAERKLSDLAIFPAWEIAAASAERCCKKVWPQWKLLHCIPRHKQPEQLAGAVLGEARVILPVTGKPRELVARIADVAVGCCHVCW